MNSLTIFYLGCVEYATATRLQTDLAALVRSGEIGDCVLLLQHPPTITMGRSSKNEHVRASSNELAAARISMYESDRGGDVTYHGPGQLVGYPVMDLSKRGSDLHAYLRDLEQVLILALADIGIIAWRFPPHTGVWVEDRKIGAIGIKVSRWITTHGFALNVDPDLGHFDLIVPCGIREFGVTSISRILGRRLDISDVLPTVSRALRSVFGSSDRNDDLDARMLRTFQEFHRDLLIL